MLPSKTVRRSVVWFSEAIVVLENPLPIKPIKVNAPLGTELWEIEVSESGVPGAGVGVAVGFGVGLGLAVGIGVGLPSGLLPPEPPQPARDQARKKAVKSGNAGFFIRELPPYNVYLKMSYFNAWTSAEGTPKIGEMQEIQMQLGRKIRELRKEKGWSQEEFADKCGIGRAHMSLIERGQQNLTLATLFTICKELDISISAMLKGVA